MMKIGKGRMYLVGEIVERILSWAKNNRNLEKKLFPAMARAIRKHERLLSKTFPSRRVKRRVKNYVLRMSAENNEADDYEWKRHNLKSM